MKRRSLIVGTLATLLALTSPRYADAEGKPAFVGNFGIYAPSGSMDLGGVLLGGEVGADFGGPYSGLMGKMGFYFDLETLREEIGSRGEVREGEWATNHLLKASVLGRVGSRGNHIAFGGFIGEANNYKILKRGFLSGEVTNHPDSNTIYGPSFEASVGSRFKRVNLYVNMGMDLIFAEGMSASPAARIGFGVSFDP